MNPINTPTSPEDRERDWTHASLRELIQHIVDKHHSYLQRELPVIEAMIAKLIDRGGLRHADNLSQLRWFFQHFRAGVEGHNRKEESVVFPAILRVEEAAANGQPEPRFVFGTLSNLLHQMEQEHETATWEFNEIRSLTGNYAVPPEADSTYRDLFQRLQALDRDTRRHMDLEHVLFTRAAKLEKLLDEVWGQENYVGS